MNLSRGYNSVHNMVISNILFLASVKTEEPSVFCHSLL